LNEETLNAPAAAAVRDAVLWKSDRRLVPAAAAGDKRWVGENARAEAQISYYLKSAAGTAVITISDALTGEAVPVRAPRRRTRAQPLAVEPVQHASGTAAVRSWRRWIGSSDAVCQGGARIAPVGTYRVSVTVDGTGNRNANVRCWRTFGSASAEGRRSRSRSGLLANLATPVVDDDRLGLRAGTLSIRKLPSGATSQLGVRGVRQVVAGQYRFARADRKRARRW
jgi:hypothetical protein